MAQIELDILKCDLAAVELGIIEDVVEHGHQQVGRLLEAGEEPVTVA